VAAVPVVVWAAAEAAVAAVPVWAALGLRAVARLEPKILRVVLAVLAAVAVAVVLGFILVQARSRLVERSVAAMEVQVVSASSLALAAMVASAAAVAAARV
jgi:hypothetical protein